jgi:hypothetical protein
VRLVSRRRVTLAGAIPVLMAMSLSAAPPAMAAEPPPTVQELLEKCGDADKCVFHPSGPPEYYLEPLAVAGQAANCTDETQYTDIMWSRTAISGNSVGTSLEVMAGPASKVFMAGFKIAFGHDWLSFRTFGNKVGTDVPAKSIAYVHFAAPMQRVRGDWEFNFGRRYRGHYYWYINNYEQWGPSTDQSQERFITRSRAMTASEYRQLCH